MLYKRILLKVSGEAMLAKDGKPIDQEFLSYLANEIKPAVEAGAQIGIVVGGGNIFRGLSANAESGLDRVTGDNMGMLATMINSLALKAAFEAHGMPTTVMSAVEINKVAEYFVRENAVRHLENGRIVVFGAGTGNPFFTTDTAAALRAVEIGADVLIKATKVDGLYDKDPKKFADAVFIKKTTYQDAIARKLKVMDMTAITLCEENKLPVKIINIFEKGNIFKALNSDEIGSLVTY